VFTLAPVAVSAGRPFVTDDATLATAGACQIELWWQASPDSHEGWLLPACNPLGNFDLTVGGTTLETDGLRSVDAVVVQGKTLLRALEPGDYGIGFAAGLTRADEDGAGTDYAYVPFSLMSAAGTTVVHINAGWQRDRERESSRTTWGIGIGHDVADRLFAFAEVFDFADPTMHLGISFRLIPDRAHIDVTYGRVDAGSDTFRFYSVGCDIYLQPFRSR
jgi:hypothetical protein